jgi:GNAT superfamily N-acetyltransferase
VGQVKRLYVRPEQRGAGIGGALLDVLLVDARRIGSRQVRLDSPRFMRAPHGLYRRTGLEGRRPYPQTEIPAEHHRHWLFVKRMMDERDTT